MVVALRVEGALQREIGIQERGHDAPGCRHFSLAVAPGLGHGHAKGVEGRELLRHRHLHRGRAGLDHHVLGSAFPALAQPAVRVVVHAGGAQVEPKRGQRAQGGPGLRLLRAFGQRLDGVGRALDSRVEEQVDGAQGRCDRALAVEVHGHALGGLRRLARRLALVTHGHVERQAQAVLRGCVHHLNNVRHAADDLAPSDERGLARLLVLQVAGRAVGVIEQALQRLALGLQVRHPGSARLAAVLAVLLEHLASIGVRHAARRSVGHQGRHGLGVAGPGLGRRDTALVAQHVDGPGHRIPGRVADDEGWVVAGVDLGQVAVHAPHDLQDGVHLAGIEPAELAGQRLVLDLDAGHLPIHVDGHLVVLKRLDELADLLARVHDLQLAHRILDAVHVGLGLRVALEVGHWLAVALHHELLLDRLDDVVGGAVGAAIHPGLSLLRAVEGSHHLAVLDHIEGLAGHVAALGQDTHRPQIAVGVLQGHLQQGLAGQVLLAHHHGLLEVPRDVLKDELLALVVAHGPLDLGPVLAVALQRHVILVARGQSVEGFLVDEAIGPLHFQRCPRDGTGLVGQLVQLPVPAVLLQDRSGLVVGHAGSAVRHVVVDLGHRLVALLGVHGMQELGQLLHGVARLGQLFHERARHLLLEVLQARGDAPGTLGLGAVVVGVLGDRRAGQLGDALLHLAHPVEVVLDRCLYAAQEALRWRRQAGVFLGRLGAAESGSTHVHLVLGAALHVGTRRQDEVADDLVVGELQAGQARNVLADPGADGGHGPAHEADAGRVLRHHGQNLLGGHQKVGRVLLVKPVLAGLVQHVLLAQRDDLFELRLQRLAEGPAQAVVPQHLMEQHPGGIARGLEPGGDQVGRALVEEALRLAEGASAALALVFQAHALGNDGVVHVEDHHHLRAVLPARRCAVDHALHGGIGPGDGLRREARADGFLDGRALEGRRGLGTLGQQAGQVLHQIGFQRGLAAHHVTVGEGVGTGHRTLPE